MKPKGIDRGLSSIKVMGMGIQSIVYCQSNSFPVFFFFFNQCKNHILTVFLKSIYRQVMTFQKCLCLAHSEAEFACISYSVSLSKCLVFSMVSLSFQGGFARCYEMLDLSSNKVYAGKIISKHRISKPHQRQKVCNILFSILCHTCI